MAPAQENGHANGYNTRSRANGSASSNTSAAAYTTNGHAVDSSWRSGPVGSKMPANGLNGTSRQPLQNGHSRPTEQQNGHTEPSKQQNSHTSTQQPLQNGCTASQQPLQNGHKQQNGSHCPINGKTGSSNAPAQADSAGPKAKAQGPDFPSPQLAARLRLVGQLLQFALALACVRAACTVAVYLQAAQKSGRLQALLQATWRHQLQLQAVPAVLVGVLLAAAVFRWGPRRKRPVYLLDFDCWKAVEHLKVSRKRFMQGSTDCGEFSPESLAFQERILASNGLGDGTAALPPALHVLPHPIITMQAARDEAEMVMFEAIERALQRTGLRPVDIDILVVNCSLFCPTPSLSAMIVNHFHMRKDVLSYNLGGMGCSAGVIAIGLADKLLQVERNAYALVVSTENITQNWYGGDSRSMLIPNTLFRMGGSAVVLTNRAADRRRAKYQLQHVFRVHLGADETAYRCVYQHADEEGTIGVALDRNLVTVAGKSLQVNMTRMGRHVLPASEKALFVLNWLARRLRPGLKPYIPDFRQAFDHFCLHAGGRGVIEGLGAQLQLDDRQRAPAAQTLYHYGNTSSSTVWYSLAFIESCQSMRRDDIVWQVGFGSGFKCNSAVWKALRPISDVHAAWEEHPDAGAGKAAAAAEAALQ